MSNKFQVSILWGHHSEHEDDDEPVTYTFGTEKELNAFLYGVDEMYGWAAYDIIEDVENWRAETYWLENEQQEHL